MNSEWVKSERFLLFLVGESDDFGVPEIKIVAAVNMSGQGFNELA